MASAENDESFSGGFASEQKKLLGVSGSPSKLNDQFVYDSTGSLISNGSEVDDAEVDDNRTLQPLTIWELICILSTAFSYGCILTTLFLITLPVECERIETENPSIPKSVSLGAFVAIAGLTQLISPLVGRLSDSFQPPPPHDIGQRLPFLVLGGVLTVLGLLAQAFSSRWSLWIRYSFAFFFMMIGVNIQYAMMLAIM